MNGEAKSFSELNQVDLYSEERRLYDSNSRSIGNFMNDVFK